jgi:hypothetical protein
LKASEALCESEATTITAAAVRGGVIVRLDVAVLIFVLRISKLEAFAEFIAYESAVNYRSGDRKRRLIVRSHEHDLTFNEQSNKRTKQRVVE